MLAYGKAAATMKQYWPKICQILAWLKDSASVSSQEHSEAPEQPPDNLPDFRRCLMTAATYLAFLRAEENRRSEVGEGTRASWLVDSFATRLIGLTKERKLC